MSRARQRQGVPVPPPVSDAIAAHVLHALRVARERGILPQIGTQISRGVGVENVGPGRRGQPISTAGSRVTSTPSRIPPLASPITPTRPGEPSLTRDWDRATRIDVERRDPYGSHNVPAPHKPEPFTLFAGWPDPYPNPYLSPFDTHFPLNPDLWATRPWRP